jgi:hypothetical protein
MSDIEDILSEFDGASPNVGGAERYIPNPSEFTNAYSKEANEGFQGMMQAGSNIYNQGFTPGNVFQAAQAGLQYLASPFTAAGKYIGGPIGRGVEDLTGSPIAGQIAGGTAELVPLMAAPFPGTSFMKGAGTMGAAAMGEGPAAASAISGLGTKIAARGAPAARSEIDDLLEEFEPASATRKTTPAKDVEYRAAEDFYRKTLDPATYGEYAPGKVMPPNASPEPIDIRLRHKGNPKVGEHTYSKDKNVIEGYQDFGGSPSYRTSHSPRTNERATFGYNPDDAPTGMLADDPAQQYLDDLFGKYQRGETLPSQMPLMPGVAQRLPESAGVNVARMQEMYLPNIERNSQVDPNLLANLKLKFGGGSPQGGTEPPWMPQQTAGQRPPASMPIMGARPYQEPQTNVIFPNEMMPVPMGIEARQNTGRIRQDLGLPPPVEKQPPSPVAEKPITPAAVDKDVTRFGDVVSGQNYDIVHTSGSMEMRAPGGTVKELITINEPNIVNGKVSYKPTSYGVLEDGRKVPIGMLKPAGVKQPNMTNMGEASSPVTPTKVNPAKASAEVVADPAFSKVQEAMTKPATKPTAKVPAAQNNPPKADRSEFMNAVIEARNKFGNKVTDDQIREIAPNATRGQIDKAIKELQKTEKYSRLVRATGDDGVPFVLMRKLEPKEASDLAKSKNFDRIVDNVIADKKFVYLRNMSPISVSKSNNIEIKDKDVVSGLNKLIKSGKIKVFPESNPDKFLPKLNASHMDALQEEDFIVEVLSKPTTKPKEQALKPKEPGKTEVRKAAHEDLKISVNTKGGWDRAKAVLDLEAEFNRGDITGTEFLAALEVIKKKAKK